MTTITKSYLKDLTYRVNGAAIEVHRHLGPGVLESVYHHVLCLELALRGIEFKREYSIVVNYKGHQTNTRLRCDLLVEDVLVVELKSAEAIHPIHEAQVLTYINLLKVPKGVIYNFNVVNLYNDGQRTLVNRHFLEIPE